VAINENLNMVIGYEIFTYQDDVMVFVDADFAPNTTHIHRDESSIAHEEAFDHDGDFFEDLQSVDTATTVRSSTEGSVTSIAVWDDNLYIEDSIDAQEFVLKRSDRELASVARNHGWKWAITPRVLELMRLKLYHTITTPTNLHRSDFDTLKNFEARLQLHVVGDMKRRDLLKIRGLTPTFEMNNPIHIWFWNFLADFQDSPSSPYDCGFEGFFHYWAADLGNLHEANMTHDQADPQHEHVCQEMDEPTHPPYAYEEPYDVYQVSTTCVIGDDEGIDDDNDEEMPPLDDIDEIANVMLMDRDDDAEYSNDAEGEIACNVLSMAGHILALPRRLSLPQKLLVGSRVPN
jgi:hypothetical protein